MGGGVGLSGRAFIVEMGRSVRLPQINSGPSQQSGQVRSAPRCKHITATPGQLKLGQEGGRRCWHAADRCAALMPGVCEVRPSAAGSERVGKAGERLIPAGWVEVLRSCSCCLYSFRVVNLMRRRSRTSLRPPGWRLLTSFAWPASEVSGQTLRYHRHHRPHTHKPPCAELQFLITV